MALAGFADTSSRRSTSAPMRRSRVAILLLLPGLAYLGLFFLAPLVSLVITSFEAPNPESFDIGSYIYSFQWQNYVAGVAEYWPIFLRSFVFAIIATVAALLIGYPIAYFIGVFLRGRASLQAFTLILVVAPFFISFLLRTLAWKQILGDDGWLVTTLKSLSIMPADGHITGTAFSVIFGLTYNFIPFMVLPIYASLERLDLRYLEASSDLYARPMTTFFKVTLPLSMPGVVSGTLLTFIPASGDYINASDDFLGGPSTQMVGNQIQANFLKLLNYPMAAVLSVVLMVIIMGVVTFYVRRSGTEDLV
jgi:spermidine/putrescine transport system permease protein